MKAIQEALKRLLRGPGAARFLRGLGIDPGRYWLLMDLFDELSERGEVLDQLGRNGVALRVLAWFCAGYSALLCVFLIAARQALATYFSAYLALTAFFLLLVLLSEAGNSLVNPVEGLVLAHQPINGATYTAAKLTHLVRIVLYLVLGVNAIPALAGLMLTGARWFYPLIHLLAALGVGFVSGLLCCALYGWLIRLLPARRLKAAAQFAVTLPFLSMMAWPPVGRFLARSNFAGWVAAEPAARWALGLALGGASAAIVTLGIRSLSADYLIRVSGIVHGGAARKAIARKSWLGELVARLFGGQPGRAGFAFVSHMARRDFQFRRQAVFMLILSVIWLVRLAASGWRTDPLSGRFTSVHFVPHLFGLVLFCVCAYLRYGDDFKASWTFLLAPARAFRPFARGVFAALYIEIIVIPHVLIFLVFAWRWGMWRAGLFAAYSLTIASVYLALELRLIDGVPFSSQLDSRRGAVLMPLMILGGVAMAIAVGLQYFFVFRSPVAVAAASAVAGVAAYSLTRSSLNAFAVSMRNSLGLLSAESGTLYREIDV